MVQICWHNCIIIAISLIIIILHKNIFCVLCSFRGYQQRLQFHFYRQHFLELEKKKNLIENYANLVLNQKQPILPITEKHYGESIKDNDWM